MNGHALIQTKKNKNAKESHHKTILVLTAAVVGGENQMLAPRPVVAELVVKRGENIVWTLSAMPWGTGNDIAIPRYQIKGDAEVGYLLDKGTQNSVSTLHSA